MLITAKFFLPSLVAVDLACFFSEFKDIYLRIGEFIAEIGYLAKVYCRIFKLIT